MRWGEVESLVLDYLKDVQDRRYGWLQRHSKYDLPKSARHVRLTLQEVKEALSHAHIELLLQLPMPKISKDDTLPADFSEFVDADEDFHRKAQESVSAKFVDDPVVFDT